MRRRDALLFLVALLAGCSVVEDRRPPPQKQLPRRIQRPQSSDNGGLTGPAMGGASGSTRTAPAKQEREKEPD